MAPGDVGKVKRDLLVGLESGADEDCVVTLDDCWLSCGNFVLEPGVDGVFRSNCLFNCDFSLALAETGVGVEAKAEDIASCRRFFSLSHSDIVCIVDLSIGDRLFSGEFLGLGLLVSSEAADEDDFESPSI